MTEHPDVVLTELVTDECWELLASSSVGRIAWTTNNGPMVIPVNYTVDDRTIRVRTGAASELARKADAERVAFEVDRLDEDTHTGWSVLARGRADVRYSRPGSSSETGTSPWPPGPHSATVEISVDKVSGRRLG